MAITKPHARIEEPARLVEAIAMALAGPENGYLEVVPGDAHDVEERIAFVR